ncbi:MAG TPA: PKD domain-containing protein [Actinospica sp.]|nr:PKD domain-containing protein [Actinospica sp.]
MVRSSPARSAAFLAVFATALFPAVATAAATPESSALRARIVGVALSQLGVGTTPPVASFGGVDCDPYSTLVAAYSPNANGCGPDDGFGVEDENEVWCADFAKWVWARAGVTVGMDALDAGAGSFYGWALDQGESPVADRGAPRPGDAVVFYKPGRITASTSADHVGLVSAVHADGTVDLVNGDFLGPGGITVEHTERIRLTAWAASVWGKGEQWVLIAPPGTAQPPAPHASISAPPTAVAGTAVDFSATASQPGGSIRRYYWTFDDGRKYNANGRRVSHVFQRAGRYTVTISATSDLGTVTTKTWNLTVSAASSAIATVPSNAVWYSTDPVLQYEFTSSAKAGLVVDSWDGVSWLQQTEPGSPAADSPTTGLTYSDPDVDYAVVPHAYYRTTAGALGETYLGANGWTTATLPGVPSARSAIQALAVGRTPSIYFFDASGRLNETTESNRTWSTAVVAKLPATSSSGSLAVSPTGSVYYLDREGRLVAPFANRLGVRKGSPLAASPTGVFFLDTAGRLAVATPTGSEEIPGTPTATSTLTATADAVFYLTGPGAPGVTARTGSTWRASVLPGAGTTIVGATPAQLFLADHGSLTLDTRSGASWTDSTLPSTPTAYPGTVLLYAANAADAATARKAAAYAGLPSTQVTTDFRTAWAATLSGDHLVIAVGQSAANALYDNPCGWSNPSRADGGSTPFSNVEHAVDTPMTNLFVLGTAADPTLQTTAVDDLSYYAVHGALPTGAGTLPTLAQPGHVCL